MSVETLFESHRARLTRRLERMVGSREAAEDLSQEAFLRLWRRGPRERPLAEQRAWLERTASNLAIDELRKRRLRDHAELEDEAVAAIAADGAEALSVADALRRLDPHQRLLVLLRFQAGLTHREIGELLAISPDAARKRTVAARRAFAGAYHGGEGSTVILLATRDPRRQYVSWLERAGAEVRPLRPGAIEPQLAVADGIVVGGSIVDIHPALYRERPRVPLNAPDLSADVRDLRVVRAALEASIPYLGICSGAQLLNIALGGSLYQDLQRDAATHRSHWRVQHPVSTSSGSHARRILGPAAVVSSEHHQGVRRLGRGLRATSGSEDSIFESIELAGDRFALGLQWHPEHQESEKAGEAVAEAVVEAATARREGDR